MNKYLVVSTKIQNGERELFATEAEALESATAQAETSFGRFSGLYVVEIKSLIKRKEVSKSHLEIETIGT